MTEKHQGRQEKRRLLTFRRKNRFKIRPLERNAGAT